MAKTISIPDTEWERLEPYRDRLPELLLLGLSQLRIQEALLLYQRGAASFGRAAEIAGVTEEELIRQARARGIEPTWYEGMADEEMA